MFEVALARVSNKNDLLKLIVMLNNMDVKDIPGITYYQTNDFEIEFLDEPKDNWCIDGEEYKSDERKFVFDVSQPMKMQVPREKISELFNEE
jgi:diacylglycerol kinase family enzyme